MESPKSLEQERKLLLENYSDEELGLFNFLIEVTRECTKEEAVSFTILTSENGSNG